MLKVRQDQLVLREQQVQGDQQDPQVLKVRQVQEDQLETQVLKVQQDLQDQQVLLVEAVDKSSIIVVVVPQVHQTSLLMELI